MAIFTPISRRYVLIMALGIYHLTICPGDRGLGDWRHMSQSLILAKVTAVSRPFSGMSRDRVRVLKNLTSNSDHPAFKQLAALHRNTMPRNNRKTRDATMIDRDRPRVRSTVYLRYKRFLDLILIRTDRPVRRNRCQGHLACKALVIVWRRTEYVLHRGRHICVLRGPGGTSG